MARTDWKTLPDRIRMRRIQLVRSVRERSHKARGTVTDRFWEARVTAFKQSAAWLGKGSEWPVVGRAAKAGQSFAERRLSGLLSHGIEGYDDLNAKDLLARIETLERRTLLALRRYETANKARKTVLGAVERAFARMDALPEPPPTTVPAPA